MLVPVNTVFIASGANHTTGLVPDPGSLSGTTKYLREDATWQVPPAGGAAPFSDATALVSNSSDATKLGLFSASGITTATTRTYTLPNGSGTLALAASGLTGGQTINGDTASGGNLVLGSTAHATKGSVFFQSSSGSQISTSGKYQGVQDIEAWVGNTGHTKIGSSIGGNPGIEFGNSSDAAIYRTGTKTLVSTAFIQNSLGRARLTADATNATATMASLSDLTITLIAGRKYTGFLKLFANNSTAAEGLAFDFNGGTATMTSLEAGFSATPPGSGLALGTLTTTALATALTVTTATTADAVYHIAISLVCNAAGTFIPRYAEVSHTSGTATVRLGSYLWLEDMPN